MTKKVTKAQIRPMLKKVNTLSCRNLEAKRKFNQMCEDYYGPVNYSDRDMDSIIDTLDYGTDMIGFDEFDEIMREINSNKGEEEW